jgi:deazaflavin-dependent oxidoreductase (nitroreductase family)
MTRNPTVPSDAALTMSIPQADTLADALPYPTGIFRRLLRLPIWLYRLGLGGLMNAISLMILTTRGRLTGLPRHTAIEYRAHGSKLYVVSGWGERPHWCQNLIADPIVTIRQGGRVFAAQARVVENTGEALRVLHLFRKRAPVFYDALITRLSDQQRVTVRSLPDVSDQFTIVRFDPLMTDPALPSVPSDLRWLWLVPLVGGLGWVIWMALRRNGNA